MLSLWELRSRARLSLGKHCAKTMPKQCIIYDATIWYHFRSCKCSQSREILEKTYKHIWKHDPSPFYIHCLTLASRIRCSASVCSICIDLVNFMWSQHWRQQRLTQVFPSSWTLFVAYNSLGRSYRKLNTTTLCFSRQWRIGTKRRDRGRLVPVVSWDRTDIWNIFKQMPTKSLLQICKDVVYKPTETRRVSGRTPFFIAISVFSGTKSDFLFLQKSIITSWIMEAVQVPYTPENWSYFGIKQIRKCYIPS